MPNKPISDDKIKEINRRIHEDSVRKIAKDLEICENTVKKYIGSETDG